MDPTILQNHIRPFGETCFGCGQQNDHGLRIQSRWEGEEGVCRWTPEPWHHAGPGFHNGGVIASVLDCHMAMTATAHAYRAVGRPLGADPLLMYVTASLRVDYLRPTPMAAVELRARISQDAGRKIVVECSLRAGDQETARGEGVFVNVGEGQR